jgi:hypothetical protein
MKIRYFPTIFLALLSGGSMSYAEPPAPITTAHVIGEIPDGRPSPELKLPEFVVPAQDILSSKTYFRDGQKITMQQIKPIALPPPVTVVAVPVNEDPAVLESPIAAEENHSSGELLCIGATVFKSLDGTPPRSLVNFWPQGNEKAGNEPITFWSSADFGLLSGFCSFVGTDEITRSLMMAWSSEMLNRKEGISRHPEIPTFPAGYATFQIIEGTPDAKTLASIHALHEVYDSEYTRLKTAYEGREQARIQHEAELKANPPKPEDIILNHWRIDPAAITPTSNAATR